MSPTEPAARAIVALIAELTDDLQAIERLVQRVMAARARMAPDDPDPTDVMAIAGFLHHVYTAMESMHERIVREVDRRSPTGDRWHSELLALMGIELAEVRPAVLGEMTRAHLSRLLRFRHFFRHAYRIDLLWLEVRPLADDVVQIAAMHRADMSAFLDHLRAALSE